MQSLTLLTTRKEAVELQYIFLKIYRSLFFQRTEKNVYCTSIFQDELWGPNPQPAGDDVRRNTADDIAGPKYSAMDSECHGMFRGVFDGYVATFGTNERLFEMKRNPIKTFPHGSCLWCDQLLTPAIRRDDTGVPAIERGEDFKDL